MIFHEHLLDIFITRQSRYDCTGDGEDLTICASGSKNSPWVEQLGKQLETNERLILLDFILGGITRAASLEVNFFFSFFFGWRGGGRLFREERIFLGLSQPRFYWLPGLYTSEQGHLSASRPRGTSQGRESFLRLLWDGRRICNKDNPAATQRHDCMAAKINRSACGSARPKNAK